jgi:hypothetical protein
MGIGNSKTLESVKNDVGNRFGTTIQSAGFGKDESELIYMVDQNKTRF